MTGKEYTPEEWPDVRGDYDRLVSLAKRRLVGLEHHAEDVVARALMKWATIPAGNKSVARIEQVIKTEAYSVIRSEQRLQARQSRYVRDPTSAAGGAGRSSGDLEFCLLRRAIVETCKREGIVLTQYDVEVFELLLAGYDMTGIGRCTGLSRYEVTKARAKWQNVLSMTIVD